MIDAKDNNKRTKTAHIFAENAVWTLNKESETELLKLK